MKLGLQELSLNAFYHRHLDGSFTGARWGDIMKFWPIAALLFFAVPQTAQSDAVLERLAKVELFAFGGTGFAGIISAGEKDYRTVLNRGSALEDFEKLYSDGNLQAKCYALVGIHRLNLTRFKELVLPLRGSKETVRTIHGCILSKEGFGVVLKQIESGKYT